MRRYNTPERELIDVRRLRVRGFAATASFQVAVERQAYSPDRLYAWQGRHTAPTREWRSGSLDSADEFIAAVRADVARS